MVTSDKDFYRKVLLISKVCELELRGVRRRINVSWHCWVRQEFIGALEGCDGCVEVGPNFS